MEDGMPAIVDPETFEKAQCVPRRKPREGEVFSEYRLSGKLFCGSCGEPMHGSGGTGKSGKRYHYYICKERGECRRRVRREFVEDAVADAVLDITADEERMRNVARRAVSVYGQTEDLASEIERCEARIAALEKERHSLTEAAMKGFVNDETVSRNEDIEKELKALRGRRGDLRGERAGFTEDDIVEFLAHGFDRDDEDFIFGTLVSAAYLYDDCIIAVLGMREDDGDLMEARIGVEQWKRKHPSLGFGCVSSGVGGESQREPFAFPVNGGFAIVVPFAA